MAPRSSGPSIQLMASARLAVFRPRLGNEGHPDPTTMGRQEGRGDRRHLVDGEAGEDQWLFAFERGVGVVVGGG